MELKSEVTLAGDLFARVIRGPGVPVSRWWTLRNRAKWGWIKSWFGTQVISPLANKFGVVTITSQLEATKIKADGRRINYGVVSRELITDDFVEYMTAEMVTETSVWGDMKYHDAGVGTTNPAVGDTAIETTDGESRATGNQSASTNTYTSAGTISYTSTKAITEHGLMNKATAGIMIDRHEFAAINVVNGDSVEWTYVLTASSGG